MKHEKIIDTLGGYQSVALALRFNPTTVFKWAKDGIPAARWCDIVALAKKKGSPNITLDEIAASRPKKVRR